MQVEQIFASWWRTWRAMRQSTTCLSVHRDTLWAALQPALARTPAIAAHVGKPLSAFPITEIVDLRSDYGAWNSLGLNDARLRALADAAEAGEEISGLSAGWSTGSGSGARGLFLSNRAERADYIGQSLARLLPARALLSRQRIALHLRAGNALYSDAGRGRFSFRHFPLATSPTETMAALKAFAPTILIAPPHRLIAFAEAGLRLPSLRHLFYGSEPISEAERANVGKHMGLTPRAIYQATEGFLGAECREGRLHLNEHAIAFELEAVPGTPGFRPIITDLRRTSQPIVRLRSDDYLELDRRACPCGYSGRVIHPIEGRMSDLWHLGGRCFTPPAVVAAIERYLGGSRRWQAVANRYGASLRVAPDCEPDIAERAARSLSQLTGTPITLCYDLAPWSGPKRNKVAWRDG